MTVRNLEKLFKPRRIALLGGCDRPGNLGRQVLRNLLNGGFEGVVYPVSRECEAIQGIATYTDVGSLPKVPDLAIVCGPAPSVPAAVERCGEAGIFGVLILSGGFREAGDEGRLFEKQLRDVVERFPGMRVVGPNSLGIIRPAIGLNASHAVTMPKAGHLAFISESRALCNSMMDWATERGIGFSTFISPGNCVDVGWGDLIDYFGNDAETRAIILYVQTIDAARRFMSAARAFALTKPIVAYKAGRFEESAQAVASHTGLMVAEDAVYEAALQRCGIVRVPELDDVFDVAELLASQRLPQGARLAIVSNAGGPAIIATDALISRGGVLAQLSDETVARLNGLLPPVGSHQNPVDLLDSAPASRYEQVLPVLLADPNVDGLLVIFAIQSGSDATATARVVAETAARSRVPVLAAWMGGEHVRAGVQILNEAGLPTHPTPEQAVRAFMHLVSYARNLGTLYETPRDIPVPFHLNRKNLRKHLQPLLTKGEDYLTENQAKTFLRAYEIPVCETCVANDEDEAVAVAERIGYPVVLKVLSPNILHKLDVGGVELNLENADAVRAAYNTVMHECRTRCAHANIKGVSVQKMVTAEHSLELIIGAKKDPTFGAVIMVGMGGIATGVLQDRAVGLPPLNERLVRRMLESLRFWPMLNGYRGMPALHLDQLIETIIRFSLLIADYPEIKEFDINPLLVTVDGVVALDAAMVLDRHLDYDGRDPYPHLAIRPCPEEYIRHAQMHDGTPMTLRSVRAEDEPLWHSMIANSSPESIRFRFRSLFKRPTHRMAIEHCVIDYERQIAIVAETEARGIRELAGVAQLIADPNHETAEFAVLVPDPWQGRKIGGTLLDYCLELAAGWGINRVVAETDPENTRMLDAFSKRGFSAEIHVQDRVVILERPIESAQTNRVVTRF
ncbi:MAG: bifunctional acetate--CoA ligase family protein/GNAT family N-acetyltransferase [Gammaproteobacteria bacterium]|nr:bifunctional acetate--CoA ligase family protein/GNAT family N-acetyltransferase [Gammaproteobacteria bacterium]